MKEKAKEKTNAKDLDLTATLPILPLVPLKDTVLFPQIITHIFVGRDRSKNAVESVMHTENPNLLFTAQKDSFVDNPEENDMYQIGVIGTIVQSIKLLNNNLKIMIKASSVVKLSKMYVENNTWHASYETLEEQETPSDDKFIKNFEILLKVFKEYVESNTKINPEIIKATSEQSHYHNIINIIASNLTSKVDSKQKILSELDPVKKLHTLTKTIRSDLVKINTEQNLQKRIKTQIEKTQKDYYLQEQMKAIQKELDDGSDRSDFHDLEKKSKSLKLSKEAKEKVESELKKLKTINQASAEFAVARNYLDVVLDMPWGKTSANPKININNVSDSLNKDHFGLDKAKERILEYIAVLERAKELKGPILCLVGPPGVGKTSLVRSIAEALGRKYAKIALGGVRDEAEIRGHRKTYIGSMPGKIISSIKKAKTDDPVILLDEIDKMSYDIRGDPSSALLEVLDPEQNKEFVDHYLDLEYDLSKVMFLITANTYKIPVALRDRMEIIDVSGYVESEKMAIAKSYLIPKQLKEHKIKKNEITISDVVILDIIRYYTKESGVRGLEREISKLIRKSLKQILSDANIKQISITNSKELEEILGPGKYRFGVVSDKDSIGLTTGMAYTEVGGELLSIEAVSFPGKTEIHTTGKLGDIMKESAQAAYSCFKSYAHEFGITYDDYKDTTIHIHVPEGAIPKDGPSAGIAIFTTIVSKMTNVPVNRLVAMTGEITLKGNVLPIGGLKEKLLAASRGGMKRVLIPEDNIKDLKDIPEDIKKTLEIIPVSNVRQVLDLSLTDKIFI
ncbi:MAG: endopeptidase La [Rickettsiaceae bacterium]